MSTKNREMPDCVHVDVADGFRAASALLVLWFHFWQQNWLRPEIALPFLAPVGLASINLEWLPRSGYLFVDALLMLSGFCLFLPVARAVAEGRPDAGRIDARDFYRRRVARILPSYLFCLAVILIFCVLPDWPYAAAKDFWTDLLAHLTFTHSFFPASYLGTQLNGALWTLSIEAQFYLLFPLLARWFARAPLRAWAVMNGISLASVAALALLRPDLGMWLNQLPLQLCTYADGMLAALCFVRLARRPRRGRWEGLIFSALALACIWGVAGLVKRQGGAPDLQLGQLLLRLPLSALFAALLVCLALSARPLRWLFSNRLMRFLSTISFNLYIWHQYLAVQLKWRWHIPAWSGELPPNQTGDRAWQWRYTLVIHLAAFGAAIACTYLIERPCARWVLKRGRKKEKAACA